MPTLKHIVLGIAAVVVITPALSAEPPAPPARDKDRAEASDQKGKNEEDKQKKDRAETTPPTASDKPRAAPAPPSASSRKGRAPAAAGSSKDRSARNGQDASAGRGGKDRAEVAPPHPPAGEAPLEPGSSGGIETAMLVLDASKSMAELAGGVPKMKIARQAVRNLVGSWDRDVPVGLTVYGHRGRGCSDIDVLVPVGPLVPEHFLDQVDKIRPSGFTPLTEAVILAAEELDHEHNQATIVVVSDGSDTCHADPCEMAKELERRALDLTIDVIGFGVGKDAGEQSLVCMANSTGGTYRSVQDLAGLDAALAGVASEVGKRKAAWRAKWGKTWGQNGRWRDGRWKRGKAKQHRHWDELRERWRKAHGAPRHGAPRHGAPRHGADSKPPTAPPPRPNPTPTSPPGVPPQGTRDKSPAEPPRPPSRDKSDGRAGPPPTPPGRSK